MKAATPPALQKCVQALRRCNSSENQMRIMIIGWQLSVNGQQSPEISGGIRLIQQVSSNQNILSNSHQILYPNE